MGAGDEQATDDAKTGTPGVSADLRERIVKSINKMVLWGEPRDDVMRKLAANGIIGDEAEAIYDAAMVERVRIVHVHYRGEATKGLCFLGPGLIGCLRFYQVFNSRQLLGIFLALGVGFWFLGKGIGGMLMAKDQEGSVADLE